VVVMNSYSVIIVFAPWWDHRHLQAGEVSGHSATVLLIASHQDSSLQFTLYDGEKPFYTLAADETDGLLRLLNRMTVRAPWDAKAGRDGTTFTLRLIGPMSHAEFDWWGNPPNEWESVGTVFDYVMSLAKRHGYGPALCG